VDRGHRGKVNLVERQLKRYAAVLLSSIALLTLCPMAKAAEIVLESTAIEKILKRDVFDAQGQYHLVEPTACTYSYLERPQVTLGAGRLRIKSHLRSSLAAEVGDQCVGGGDAFYVTVSGRPAFKNDRLLVEDIRLDDVSDLAWRALLEVFMKRAAPRVLEINLREALEHMLAQSNPAYQVVVEKIVVTKILAEENRLRATFDFVMRAR
jgi:hypothetical protein